MYVTLHFAHSPAIWREFPELVPGVLIASVAAAGCSPSLTTVAALLEALRRDIATAWTATRDLAVLTAASPQLEFSRVASAGQA